jgi:hypothetical protein
MAYEIPGFVNGVLVAGDDLRAAQYRFVDGTAGDKIGLAAGAGHSLGVLNNAPPEGGVCEIVTSGVAKVKCDGPIAEFAGVQVGANGGGAVLAAGIRVGTALEAALLNQVISVQLELT